MSSHRKWGGIRRASPPRPARDWARAAAKTWSLVGLTAPPRNVSCGTARAASSICSGVSRKRSASASRSASAISIPADARSPTSGRGGRPAAGRRTGRSRTAAGARPPASRKRLEAGWPPRRRRQPRAALRAGLPHRRHAPRRAAAPPRSGTARSRLAVPLAARSATAGRKATRLPALHRCRRSGVPCRRAAPEPLRQDAFLRREGPRTTVGAALARTGGARPDPREDATSPRARRARPAMLPVRSAGRHPRVVRPRRHVRVGDARCARPA